jgi:hypothetical protein
MQLPSIKFGGTAIGRAALAVAINELKSGAREIGGANSGEWVNKYLNGLAPEGSSWCAAFVSYCFANSGLAIPFQYSVSTRDLLNQLKNKNWSYHRESGIIPEPGDIVIWWRGSPESWQGHAGLVHHYEDGILHTIEGNRTSKVAGFSYKLKTVRKLLGLGRVPDESMI